MQLYTKKSFYQFLLPSHVDLCTRGHPGVPLSHLSRGQWATIQGGAAAVYRDPQWDVQTEVPNLLGIELVRLHFHVYDTRKPYWFFCSVCHNGPCSLDCC